MRTMLVVGALMKTGRGWRASSQAAGREYIAAFERERSHAWATLQSDIRLLGGAGLRESADWRNRVLFANLGPYVPTQAELMDDERWGHEQAEIGESMRDA